MELKHVEKFDFDFYYKLKCEKSAIDWGGWEYAPSRKRMLEHFESFLKRNLNEGRLYIIQEEGVSVGYIQYTFYGNEAEIAIGIAEGNRGKGYGASGIYQAVNRLWGRYTSVIAWIREDNIMSQKIFKKNGFVGTSEKRDIYVPNLKKNIWMNKWVKDLNK